MLLPAGPAEDEHDPVRVLLVEIDLHPFRALPCPRGDKNVLQLFQEDGSFPGLGGHLHQLDDGSRSARDGHHHSRSEAIRAPSTSACNFNQAAAGCQELKPTKVANPQSVPAMPRSCPPTSAK